jgi:phosphopantothenoylcysteine decarboxylase/phosphopantothenate--cysteine ligase
MALIALGVTGGIGAYKAVEVCRGLQQRGHDVVAVMTRSASRFVGPVTFEAISRRPVITSQWRPGMNADIEHVALADGIGLLLVAPCTANIIGKFANGIADDFLTSLYLATKAPVMLAPAMNSNMLAHEAVQRNVETLARRGVEFVEPGEGYLACGWIGRGRLAEPAAIVEAAERLLSGGRASLGGRRILVTAGPTYEDIDPVRYVGNRSSGRMGFAIAAEAQRRGARVTLVAGPTPMSPPSVEEVIRVRSASDMHQAVMRAAADSDAIVMAAAVADYTPVERAPEKVTKADAAITITLKRTRDILADLGAMRADLGPAGPVLVGFAAETEEVVPRARAKRVRKKVDLMVANDVSMPDRGFDSETNAVTIVAEDDEQAVPLQGKDRVAAVILDRIEQLLRTRAAAATRA